MLDLRRLNLFVAVARRESFSAAALDLSYTQSSVSQAVADLERDLGVTLLDRSSRPVTLTPAGELVLGHAEGLLGQAKAIEEDLAALGQGQGGRLRMAGFSTAWSSFLPRVIAAYARARPLVELDVEQRDPPEALRLLRAGELDLAVVYSFAGDPAGEHFQSAQIGEDPYALAIPTRSPWAKRRRLDVADLAKARWCSPPLENPAAAILREYCREHGGFEPHLAYPLEDVAMAQPLVAAGLGVALLPALSLAWPYPGVTVRVPPQAPPGRSVWSVIPANRRVPAAHAMARLLAATGAERPLADLSQFD